LPNIMGRQRASRPRSSSGRTEPQQGGLAYQRRGRHLAFALRRDGEITGHGPAAIDVGRPPDVVATTVATSLQRHLGQDFVHRLRTATVLMTSATKIRAIAKVERSTGLADRQPRDGRDTVVGEVPDVDVVADSRCGVGYSFAEDLNRLPR
jgi:hypothetical protein